MSTNLFNTQLLDATIIKQGEDILLKLIATKLAEWLPQVDAVHHQHFLLAIQVYTDRAKEIASEGDPEKMVKLVEDFREYQPMFKSGEFAAFDQICFNFSKHLGYAIHSTYPVDPVKYRQVSAPFVLKATAYRESVQEIRKRLDKLALAGLVSLWNKVAEEWKKAVDEAFPMNDLVSHVVNPLGY